MSAWDYIGKDPEANIPKVLDAIERLDTGRDLSRHITSIRKTMNDPESGMRKLALSLFSDIDAEQLNEGKSQREI